MLVLELDTPRAALLRSFWQARARALIVCGIAASLPFVACAETGPYATQGSESASDLVRCMELRPEICTQGYQPVCAMLSGGSEQTYASGYVACADARVLGYRLGPCK